jgi:type II secretory pathway pseudopilin PulG
MSADLHRLGVARGVTPRVGQACRSQAGFSALELVVITIIVCSIVAIGFPVLHSRAKAAVLEVNSQSLGAMVTELVAEGYSAQYRPTGEGDPQKYLSAHLEETLRAAGSAGYVNPVVGQKDGRVILNSASRPTDPKSPPPAVFITNAPECQYEVFRLLNMSDRLRLAGTILVVFNSAVGTVELFSIDAGGGESAAVVSIPAK